MFSNVFSNCLPERMHNHIGRICLNFLHCVFSNVSIKNFDQRRQSHIGCICLTFLHCAFLNVSSKHQLKKMQSYIGCNCAWHCELCSALWIVRGIVNCARHCALTIVGRGYGLITKEEVMSQLKKGRGYVTIADHLWLTDERTRVGIELLGQLKKTLNSFHFILV